MPSAPPGRPRFIKIKMNYAEYLYCHYGIKILSWQFHAEGN